MCKKIKTKGIMNDYKIPIIEPTIDYTKVPPINQKRTITFINHFIIHTVTFLNKFALSCEERLFEFENKLQRVEASLAILESRLSSIPGLDQDISNECNTQEKTEDNTDNLNVDNISDSGNIDKNKSNNEGKSLESLRKDPSYEK